MKTISVTYKEDKETVTDVIEDVKFIAFERNFIIVVSNESGKKSYYKNSIVQKISEKES